MIKQMKTPLIVTGLSGAGISTVLKALEDFRYEVFDNFPLPLVGDLQNKTDEVEHAQGIAFGIDTRTRGFSSQAVQAIAKDIGAKIVFITADDSVLHKRFKETRRRHPFSKNKSVSYGIREERSFLEPLIISADIVIDTTETSIHDLRHILEGHFALQPTGNLTVSLMSFGFKYGSPREADIMMDVRFLKNPHWNPELKPQTGLDAPVGLYIEEDQDFSVFLNHFKSLIQPLIPRYAEEGKSYLTIAIGCTGGRHRSVYTVQKLVEWMMGQGICVDADHRDIKKADK